MVTILLQKILDLLRKMLRKPGVNESSSGSEVASFTTNTEEPLTSATFNIPYDAEGYEGITVYHTGKNLFDKNQTLTAGIINSEGQEQAITSYVHTDFIRVNAETTYTTSGDVALANTRNAIACYDEDQTFIERLAPDVAGGWTFTTPANTAYIIMNLGGTNRDLNTIQLEEGSSATTYAAYKGNVYEIAFNETVYGGSIEVISGKLTSTYNEDGTTKSTPEVIMVTPAEINSYVGINYFWSDINGSMSFVYRFKIESQTELQEAVGSGNYTDLTSGLTINTECIEEASADIRAYQQGNLVYVQIQNLKYTFMPEDTTVIVTGLPKPVAATNACVGDGYDLERVIRLRVNTDGELQQWYSRPAGNHVAVGGFVYITDEV